MGRSQRIGLIVAAVIVAVAAVVILSTGDDDSSDNDNGAQTTTTAAPGKPSAPEVPTIKIKNGKPVGGIRVIQLDKCDRLKFRVKSDAEHEIHLHGYDIEKEVAAGDQVTYDLEANIDGIFEAEIEDLKQQIAEIRVNP